MVKELKINKTRGILLTASPQLVRNIIRHADEQGLLRTHVFMIIELWEEWMYKEDDLDVRFNGILFVRPTVLPVNYEYFQKLKDAAIREKVVCVCVCACVRACVLARACVHECVCGWVGGFARARACVWCARNSIIIMFRPIYCF